MLKKANCKYVLKVQEYILMEPIVECKIDLFADELPSMDKITELSAFVHSSEKNRYDFTEQLESNAGKTSAKAALAVGTGLFILGRDAEAVARLEKADDCKEKFTYLAIALRRLGRFDEAIENLDKSLQHGAKALNVSLEKAATYRAASNFDAADEELKSCANFERVSADYHYELARLEESRGLYDQAIDNYKIALELSPNCQKALFRLAYRYDLSGYDETAIEYYNRIAVGSPVYVNALMNLAVLYEDRGDYEKGSQCVGMVLKHHPNHKRAILFKKDIESSKTMFYDEEKEKTRDRKVRVLETPISDFELSVRSRNCFRKMNIQTLGDLMNITEAELLSYKNFGETSLKEIKIILESKGLQLGGAVAESQQDVPAGDEDQETESANEAILAKPVAELRLSARAGSCLQKLEIRTLNDLVRKTDAELLGCKNFGVTSLNEIKKALANVGLSLRSLD